MKKHIKIILISVFLIFSVNLYSQSILSSSPEEAGLSTSKLNQYGITLQEHVNNGEIPGAVVLIARYGKIAYFKTFGEMDIEKNIPMRKDALFRLASMTKLFTSIAVMILYEEGHFTLNEPISKYIPEFKNMKVALSPGDTAQLTTGIKTEPAVKEISIRDLLRHTSGLTYSSGYPLLNKLYRDSGLDAYRGPAQESLYGFIKTITKIPLAFHPGTNWQYSYSADVLGYLIETVTGKSLEEFMNERIFQPLKLKSTGFSVADDKIDKLVNVYNVKESRFVLEESAEKSSYRKSPGAFSGGGGWDNYGYGGLISTAYDYAVVLQMLLNKGRLNGRQILGKKTVELMLIDHLVDIPNNWLGSGVGFSLCSAVLKNISEYGNAGSNGQIWWAGSLNTYFFMDPKEEMLGVFMINVLPFGHLGLMGKFKTACMFSIVN